MPSNFNTKPTKPTVARTNPAQFASIETFVNVELDWIERVLGRSHNTKNIDEKEEWNYSELDELNKILQCNELSTYITTADRI